jgi:hypothetical protein
MPPPADGDDEPELAIPDPLDPPEPEPEPPLIESLDPLLPPQAVTATASPARPIPASAARRGQTGWDSCVTVFLRDQ